MIPEWVRKRDGRLQPFDADKICLALFTTLSSLGHPDAFLARELTDGVVHFLVHEGCPPVPSTREVAEVVIQTVRELGHPALARAFAVESPSIADCGLRIADSRGVQAADQGAGLRTVDPSAIRNPQSTIRNRETPEQVRNQSLRDYSLEVVFTRDLVAAQAEGLLTLTGLAYPDRLERCQLSGQAMGKEGVLAALAQIRPLVGQGVIVDGPEYLLADRDRAGHLSVARLAQELLGALRLTGLRAVVNLNVACVPPWANDLAEGPLFVGVQRAPRAEHLGLLALELAGELLAGARDLGPEQLRVDWHLGASAFQRSGRSHLQEVSRWALSGAPLAFVFDRPRRAIALAEGLTRQQPGILLTVGVHLPQLARLEGMDEDRDRFVYRLGSLARLARTAAARKRGFLRNLEGRELPVGSGEFGITSGFLLDRSRLMVAPVGLDAVVRSFAQQGLAEGESSRELGKRIIARLRQVLEEDARPIQLDTCVDAPATCTLGSGLPTSPESIAGLTPWEVQAPPLQQMEVAGSWHAAAGQGTLSLLLAESHDAREVAGWLQQIWKQSEIIRLRLVRPDQASRQLTFTRGEKSS